MGNQSTTPVKNPNNQIREWIGGFRKHYDPDSVLGDVGSQLEALGKDYYFHDELCDLNDRAMTLHEFDNGILMSKAIPDEYATFAIDFSRKLQREYDCKTTVEQSLAELATVNFIRVLDTQKRLNEALDNQKTLSSSGRSHEECENRTDPFYPPLDHLHACKRAELGLKLLNVLSKELNQANRQFVMAIQTLIMMKQPPMQVNIKTNTAVVGQNQIVRTNGHG